jgi:hypothetical protein
MFDQGMGGFPACLIREWAAVSRHKTVHAAQERTVVRLDRANELEPFEAFSFFLENDS